MKAFFTVLGALAIVAVAFLVFSLALWWLVPAAFLVPFSFTQAMATTGLLLMFAGLVSAKE